MPEFVISIAIVAHEEQTDNRLFWGLGVARMQWDRTFKQRWRLPPYVHPRVTMLLSLNGSNMRTSGFEAKTNTYERGYNGGLVSSAMTS